MWQQIRLYSKLSHINKEGKAHMVDVSDKHITKRTATAQGSIYIGSKITALIKENNMKKGDVLSVSQLAGIMAAKKTPDLIPLCHNISLNSVDVEATLDESSKCVLIRATVVCNGKTGVEMEALTAVSIAALTVYDMCKAVTHDMCITDIKLVKKTGGTSDYFICK